MAEVYRIEYFILERSLAAYDYTSQFIMKWKKNQSGGRRVVGQAKCLSSWHKVDGRLRALSNRLRRQCYRQNNTNQA